MRCFSCTTENPDGNRFCQSCGAQFNLACSVCGHSRLPVARFCGNCGISFVLVHENPRGLAEPSPKWGELKQATVLFADIVGSTEHIAGLDAEQAMERMRPAVLRMCDSVERFGGTVMRTLGDGVMALFGVPRALEGHALLACKAALHMQTAFRHDSRGLAIRVGLHSGQVASDPQDALDGKGGGAHGVTIHLASRVVGLAQPGGICFTQACRALVGAACESLPLGYYTLKGIGEAVDIHALTGLKSVNGYEQPSSIALTPFRGRRGELEILLKTLDAIDRREAKVVGIVAEPGTGKSRLCQELSRICRERGMSVYEVRAQLYEHAMPLQPVLELFRIYFFGIKESDDAACVRQRIAQVMSPLTPVEVDLALLYEFFGVAEPGNASPPLEPRLRQSRLLG